MNSTLNKIVIFALGAAVGSLATWKFLKTKYEQIAQEEIDSVKEVFARREMERDEESDYPHVAFDEPCVDSAAFHTELSNKISELGYSNDEGETPMAPYIITPDEFGEFDDYETISLTYYADGVLTDDMDEPIEDVDGLVGVDSLSHFGEYEDDSVFVRNDRMKADYEILSDLRNYSDIKEQNDYDT